MRIDLAGADELAQVAVFYDTAGYGGGVSQADLTLLARNDAQLLGVVRLCDEHGVIVLRGMQIHARHQRQGIGTALLQACAPHLNRADAYCLPYDHLVAFYRQAGFEVAEPGTLPGFLAARLDKYLASGQRVLAMYRAATRQGSPPARG